MQLEHLYKVHYGRLLEGLIRLTHDVQLAPTAHSSFGEIAKKIPVISLPFFLSSFSIFFAEPIRRSLNASGKAGLVNLLAPMVIR